MLGVRLNGFFLRLPEDTHKDNGILVFVDCFSKMVHLAAVLKSTTAQGCSRVFVDMISRFYGLPRKLVSDHNPRFTVDFWQTVLRTLGTRLKIYTSYHPGIDVERNGITVSSKKSFEAISTRSWVVANSYPWWNSPSITRYMLQHSIHRYS